MNRSGSYSIVIGLGFFSFHPSSFPFFYFCAWLVLLFPFSRSSVRLAASLLLACFLSVTRRFLSFFLHALPVRNSSKLWCNAWQESHYNVLHVHRIPVRTNAKSINLTRDRLCLREEQQQQQKERKGGAGEKERKRSGLLCPRIVVVVAVVVVVVHRLIFPLSYIPMY